MLNPRHFKKLALVFTLILLTALFLGCAPQETLEPTQEEPAVEEPATEAPEVEEPVAEEPETEEPEAEEPEVEEPVTEEPVAEPTSITILVPDNPVAFNGLNTDTGYEQAMGELIMLSLSETDPNGNVFPELAVEIPTIENGGVIFDEETWSMDVTWQIRDDVYWSDGEQLTVDDVIFTWDVIVEEAWTPAVDYTESIEKIDDFTFVVHFYEGWIFPDYALQFGGEDFFVYPEHYCDAEQGFYEWDCENQPLSSGPYILEEWVADDHLTFVRNPNYYEEGKPTIDQVIIRITPEESVERVLMLEGDADVHYWPGENIGEEYRTQDNGVNFAKSPTERWVMRLIPNMTVPGDETTPHPFLSDVLVRRAIRMAVDVDTILEEVFLGHGEPVWTEFFRPPYNVCDIPQPEFDLEGAAALLEQAGWTDSDDDGVRECNGCPNAEDGTPMTMDFAIYAEYGETLELAQQLIAENLEAIGFDVELQIIEGAVMWAPAEDGGTELAGNFELDMWDDGYPGLDPTDNILWTYYLSDNLDQEGFNVMRWSNEEFDTLLDELYILDEEYRKEVFCDIADILEEELPQILLWSALEAHGVSERLEGVQPNANDPLTWNVADWTLNE
ncbi:MAG: peptide ABC transporter substrate-binding protein [Anaerolineales bacterium]|jgi:peptide/nickel transport system substrate-binding protein